MAEVKLERCEALNGKPEYVKRPVRRCALCGALVYVQRTDRVIPICRDCWKEAFMDGEAEEARPPPSGEGVLPVRVHLNRYTRKGTKPVKTVENSPPGGASRLRGKRPPRGTDRPGRERNRKQLHGRGRLGRDSVQLVTLELNGRVCVRPRPPGRLTPPPLTAPGWERNRPGLSARC